MPSSEPEQTPGPPHPVGLLVAKSGIRNDLTRYAVTVMSGKSGVSVHLSDSMNEALKAAREANCGGKAESDMVHDLEEGRATR
jgi:hypothetical protein